MSDIFVELSSVVLKEIIKIAIPPTLAQAKKLLRVFADNLNQNDNITAEDHTLPTAALLGLGRCGTNVCTEVARLLEQALAHNQTGRSPQEDSMLNRAARMLNFAKEQGRNPYLFQPVILLADLDQQSTVQQHTLQSDLIVPGYQRCRLIDLRWLFKQGCGNVPQVGQYLTRLALKTPLGPDGSETLLIGGGDGKQETNDKFTDWESARAYFLDTVGLNENPSRLMFFIFSTGGGTGSGMSPELGTAQRFLAYKRALADDAVANSKKPSHMESSCSVGLGIMPTSVGEDQKDSQSMNTGRSVLNYLARLQRHSVLSAETPVISEIDLPPFNCLTLVSNDIMASNDAEAKTSFESAAQQANAYISQQIFNLLVAQSLPTDYRTTQKVADADSRDRINAMMSLGGIEKSEMIRLDPADLKNSLYGVSVVGYAEMKDMANQSISELVIKAVSPPMWNSQTESVDGLSILPMLRGAYEEYLRRGAGTSDQDLIAKLSQLLLFRKAISVVTIVSVPKADMLKQATVRELRSTVVKLFPKAKIRRYAVLPEASKNITISFFICGSGYFTAEVQDHLNRYMLNCFCLPEFVDTFQERVSAYVKGSEDASRDDIAKQLRDSEDVTQILAALEGSGALLDRKIELETRAAELLGAEQLPFQSVFLTKNDVLDALDYMKSGWKYNGPIQPATSSLI